MANEVARYLTSDNFQSEVLDAKEPVLVDFWAAWCGPCRAVAPAVEALAEEYQGRVRVAKLDVDEAPDIAGRYDVRSIPTLLLFKDGQVVDRRVGAASKKVLENWIAPYAVAARAAS